jgi:hypothetical protein
MRGTVAKRLRREVYGEGSKRNPGVYKMHKKTGQIFCHGLRSEYLLEKKDYTRTKD